MQQIFGANLREEIPSPWNNRTTKPLDTAVTKRTWYPCAKALVYSKKNKYGQAIGAYHYVS